MQKESLTPCYPILWSGFEFSNRNADDELWAKEAESRIDAYEKGEISAIPAKDVFEKLTNNAPAMRITVI